MWIEFTKIHKFQVNGVPWIAGSSLALVYSASAGWSPETQHQLVVLNFGLLLDLFASAAIKLTVQRPRPVYNKNDMFSFFVFRLLRRRFSTVFHFLQGTPRGLLCWPHFGWHSTPQYRFAAAGLSFIVAFSRVAMGRHYLSDALAGLALGYIEGFAALALRPSFSRWLCKILR
ncbi:PAP2 family protein [Oesophagostomum dentatum]|uniref:PAP2 family protein n=1 Tax=Oesophagostomum dentatum TaxID=61180 RepID=A0A0B1SEV3_OESDE|nr:PAP2 family protein [Oesophagostomum dentatum]